MKSEKYSAILGSAVGFKEMEHLTTHRPLANLPFDGKYRLIDFPLSTLANAGIKSIYGIFRSDNIRSVLDHVRSGREWGLNSLLSQYFLGFYNTKDDQKEADKDYYDQVLTYLKRSGSNQTVYMSCDILCNIDLNEVIDAHQQSQAMLTVVYKNMPTKQVSDDNAILSFDESGLVTASKPVAHEMKESFSAGLYIINTNWLIQKMEKEAEKAEPQKLRYLLRELAVTEAANSFEYNGYLANIYSVKSYYDANMDMLEADKFHSLLYSNQKIYTRVKNEEATYFSKESHVESSQIASGCVVKGQVQHSIISRNCYLETETIIKDSILSPKAVIGEKARIEYAIIDKSVTVSAGITIRGTKDQPIVIPKGTKVVEDVVR
ncbi:glucose-1-phosphate adenylyltransferase subunit GlgD [Streptococcus iniae]|uniref:Glucose-1-phosphate adenylyltransferase subunit GlgD n=3 Tax=Streptococcus iniae TaxID=1346 RepID=A0A3L8M0Y6_STRIN|nr:glucose-1-phosphate adenylyltransferase subunit GlgD [Streptococcus iniae]AJG26145.1 glucose-1-phosphate adenylyltransferase [Streptococcus iniae]ASL34971.1 glycogen biosynthesis protein [Streptococcus iniae]ATX39946.1 Glycogen biosynthesis protein GlgD [Streptococcus iniae]EKB52934.1 glucose-1-phosphate adenylyltransferase [Streptococcus iniae 9117]ELY5746928.1 glucose-1-phosphate adenylyltransferase subunit GlgD [Streptococcus iniae]